MDPLLPRRMYFVAPSEAVAERMEELLVEVKLQGLDDYELLARNLGEARLVEAQVRLNHRRRQASQPLVKRDVLENVRGEHLEEYRVGVPSVLDIMRGVGRNIADVVWIEVNRACVVDREKDNFRTGSARSGRCSFHDRRQTGWLIYHRFAKLWCACYAIRSLRFFAGWHSRFQIHYLLL
jgi:hypothetical protein